MWLGHLRWPGPPRPGFHEDNLIYWGISLEPGRDGPGHLLLLFVDEKEQISYPQSLNFFVIIIGYTHERPNI